MTGKRIAQRADTPARKARRWTVDGLSELEAAERDARLAVELAAAALDMEFSSLLARAIAARPDISRRDLAECLQVTEGRVSQVLSGEDAPKATTLARYMRALGYFTHVYAQPAEPAAPPIDEERRPNLSRKVISRTVQSPAAMTIRRISSGEESGSAWTNELVYVHAKDSNG